MPDGVGPHFDSYGVFLPQVFGARRWSIAETDDLELLPNSDFKFLRRFRPQALWDLDSGDILYLPPQCAHDGEVLTESFTYSVGFALSPIRNRGTLSSTTCSDHLRGTWALRRPRPRPATASDGTAGRSPHARGTGDADHPPE